MFNEDKWYESWFDSPYYSMLYRNHDNQEAQQFIDNLLKYINPPQNAEMLDLACGRGRHSIYLASKGYQVTGIDLSHYSIMDAKKHETANLSFYEHDIRQFFRITYYDYVFNFFTSFGYFEKDNDNLKVLTSAYCGLKKGGTLMIDFMNQKKVKDNLIAESIKQVGDIEFKINKSVEGNFIKKQISLKDKGKEFHFCEKVQTLTLEDFIRYFDKVGFKLVSVFGDYQLNVFNVDLSDRLILVVEK